VRRTIRAVPILALGGILGGLVAGLAALVAVPFLVRRVVEMTASFQLQALTVITGLTGLALGSLCGGVVKLGSLLLRRPDDPPPRRPPTKISFSILVGTLIGGFFGFALVPIFKSFLAHYDNGQFLLSPGRFVMLSIVIGVAYGIAAAGFIVGFVPSIAPVGRIVRVRAQHLYEGPVTDMTDLGTLVNRIKEGGEDALAAGKHFHLS
jgi:hypothetical protein